MSTTTKKIGVLLAVVWCCVSFIPYALIGETWGMVWVVINYPLSEVLVEFGLGNWGYPVVFVAVTTLLNAGFIFFIVWFLGVLLARRHQGALAIHVPKDR